MGIKTVTLAPRGTARREVALADLRVPDYRPHIGLAPTRHWRGLLADYFADLTGLLFAARIDADYPAYFHVPDLWHVARSLPSGPIRESVLTAWGMGHDLAEALGFTRVADHAFAGQFSVYTRTEATK